MTSGLPLIAAKVRTFMDSTMSAAAYPARIRTGALEEEFNTLALELFDMQYRANPAYRRLCAARGIDAGSIAHWSLIPAVPSGAFKELDMTCLPAGSRTTVFHSSGTSEQRPSRHYHSQASLELYQRSLWPWFRRHVLDGLMPSPSGGAQGGWRLCLLTPPAAAAPHSSLVHMLDTVRIRSSAESTCFLGVADSVGAWSLDMDRALAALGSAGGAFLLLGTAFSFVHLLEGLVARQAKLTLPAGSRVMETGGYKGRSREMPRSELHARIEESLGVPRSHIVSEYGMSEISSQAYDGIAGRPGDGQAPARIFRFPPWCRVQVVSPETGREVREGEPGLLRLFDLANVWSVMAVQTEDLGVCRGDGFELSGRALLAEPRGCSLMATQTWNL